MKKFFTIAELNGRIRNFEYSANEARDKPQVFDKKSFEVGSTLVSCINDEFYDALAIAYR
jgi:hypothetical protein